MQRQITTNINLIREFVENMLIDCASLANNKPEDFDISISMSKYIGYY
jgi:hypothetical protein